MPRTRTSQKLLLASLLVGCGSSPPVVHTPTPGDFVSDRDRDGVVDGNDFCVDDAEDADGHLDHDGCPDLDDDGDRIADSCDACPRRPETRNGEADADGCPDGDLPAPRDLVLESVTFTAGAATLTDSAIEVLIPLARALRDEPQLEHLVVVGLAASDEPDPVALSAARAARVRTFLVAHGVDGVRLEAQGFGANDPLPTTTPWPSRHAASSVWLVVDRMNGGARHVLRDGHFAILPATTPQTQTAPPRAPLCPQPTR